MPDQLPFPPRLLVEPEEHIWAGQTATQEALDLAADDKEPLTISIAAAHQELDDLRRGKAWGDSQHPEHPQAVARAIKLSEHIHAKDADAPGAEPTREEQIAALDDQGIDRELIDAGAVALMGDQGPATIEADTTIANDPEAIKLLGELGQLERDFPGAAEGVRLHLHLLPAQAKQMIAEKRDDQKFMQAYHNNADFRHNAAVGEMRALNLIAEGGILKWQQQQQAQPQS